MEFDQQPSTNFVRHGRLNCDRCWRGVAQNEQENGSFRLVRDPGHWGSESPSTLVLGISKGNTQSKAFANEAFDGIAFKGIRPRLLQVLQAVGLLQGEGIAAFERRFRSDEMDFAFASVIRCSLTGRDSKKGIHTADSPNVVPALKLGSAGYQFAAACVDQHLRDLPPRTQRVILLGNADAYVFHLRDLIGRIRGSLHRLPQNDMAYYSKDVLFVHVAHPSKGNGHFGAFIRGEGKPGAKLQSARAALVGK